MADHLATVQGPGSNLQFAVRTTALAGDDVTGTTFEDTLLRVRDGMLDTPAGTLSELPAVYTSYSEDFLDRIDVTGTDPVSVLVDVHDLQLWLEMLPDTDTIEMQFYGDRETGIAEELVLDGEDSRVTVQGSTADAAHEGIALEMPSVFASGRFHDEDGEPAPTVGRTTGDALERLVEIVDATGRSTYPVHLDADGLVVDVASDGVRVETSLPGALLEGEPVYNDYGDGFSAMARTLSGTVRIETGPGAPAAFVRDGEGYTLRAVLEQA